MYKMTDKKYEKILTLLEKSGFGWERKCKDIYAFLGSRRTGLKVIIGIEDGFSIDEWSTSISYQSIKTIEPMIIKESLKVLKKGIDVLNLINEILEDKR